VTTGETYTGSDTVIYNGAWIHERREPQVLYPTRCSPVAAMNLTLEQKAVGPGNLALGE
jgi:hypothetical protein